MALNTLFKRATNLFGFGHCDNPQPPSQDSEIVFCKNNVCVHPPSTVRQESEPIHRPGYLTIRCHQWEGGSPTLILSWIPNSTLHKNPLSLENVSPSSSRGSTSGCGSPRWSPGPSFHSHVTMCSPFLRRASISSEISMDEGYKLAVKEAERQDSISMASTVSDCCSIEKDPSSSYIDSHSQVDSGIGVSGHESDGISLKSNPHDEVHSQCQNSSPMYNAKTVMSNTSPQQDRLWAVDALHGASISKVNVPDRVDHVDKNLLINQSITNVVTSTESKVSSSHNEGEEIDDAKTIQALRSEIPSPKDATEIDISSLTISPEVFPCDTNNDDKCLDSDGDSESGEGSVMENQRSSCYQSNICSESYTSDFSTIVVEGSSHAHASTSQGHSDSTSLASNQFLESCPPSPTIETTIYSKRLGHNWLEETPESLALHHNLTFQDGPSSMASSTTTSRAASPIRRSRAHGVFTIDLGKMRSLRLFFSNRECTCGQLVIASMESQYKILHFHHGGLDHLAHVFEDWNFLMKAEGESEEARCNERHKSYRQFMVCRPEVTEAELHPEEGSMYPVDESLLAELVNEEGQIEDDFYLRKAIFFAGVDPSVKKDVWPFLFHYFPYDSTYEERDKISEAKCNEYEGIRSKRETMCPSEREVFWHNVECIVEKDVIRTDRNNPFFAGEGNPNIEKMKNILLNYAVSMGHPYTGYTQGMSDLLAPVLAEIQTEHDAYGCFVGLMQKTIFVSSPTDADMDRNLTYLRGLIALMAPQFYEHLLKHVDALELLFCHRWILLCFKREFDDPEALSMWEACWANYQTDYFHLFLCLAIICVYGGDVVCQNLRTDETLLHFSSLAMHMDGDLILRKARGLLHQFRKMPRISCTLSGLCELCGPGIWDSGHAPIVECIGHPEGEECPYTGEVT